MKSEHVITQLNALAQEQRLKIFRVLMVSGETGLCVSDIASDLDISPATLSFHLKELNQAGLILSERQGRHIIYSLNIEAYKELITFLTEDCCKGNAALCKSTNNCC